jgi:hypothetical protein
MAASNEEFPHRIGLGSTYDSDMNLTEDIVNAYKYKENKVYQYILYSYYMSRAYSYFSKAEEYIYGETIKKDFKKISREFSSVNFIEKMKILNFTRDNFESVKIIFDDLIDYTKDNYEKTNICNSEDFNKIFYFIGSIFCLEYLPEEYDISFDYGYGTIPTEKRNSLYPLPNDTGLFSINSYMYALFEDVYLLGIPTKATYYDGVFNCVKGFLRHDIAHSSDEIEIGKEIIEEYKKLYIAIINDSEFSQEEKELHILVMWYILHEKSEKTVYDISVYISREGQNLPFGIENAFISDFLPDFKKFSSFAVNDDIIRIMTVQINNFYTREHFTYEEIYKRISDPNSTKYPSYICSACFIYSIQKISTKFNDLIKEIIQSREMITSPRKLSSPKKFF